MAVSVILSLFSALAAAFQCCGVSLHVNAGHFSTTNSLGGLPHLPGVPHLHVNRPLLAKKQQVNKQAKEKKKTKQTRKKQHKERKKQAKNLHVTALNKLEKYTLNSYATARYTK